MGVCHSAKLVYGVFLSNEDIANLINLPNWDKIRDEWVINTNAYNADGENLIGIVVDSIEAGESTEVCVITPKDDELIDILDELNINSEPTWHLACVVD